MKILLMMVVVQSLNLVIFAWFKRVAWVRILVLRQQLAVYKRKSKKPLLRNKDRLFWSFLSKIWRDWTSELILVRPETVIRWRKRKFREFWRTMSHGRSGRPPISNEHINFIRRISSDHPEYGEDRIALKVKVKFGIHHACSTVRKYMVKRRLGPTDSQAWRSFLKNQAKVMWSCDFFVQHTVGFRVLYVFVIMALANRKVIHMHVTDHPTLECRVSWLLLGCNVPSQRAMRFVACGRGMVPRSNASVSCSPCGISRSVSERGTIHDTTLPDQRERPGCAR